MKKILLGLVVCAAFCACSNDDVVLTSTTTPAIGGDGYVSLSINLPTNPSTRANDNFDDGLPSEYAVHDAYLLLFAGNDEASAVLYDSPYLLTTSFEMVGTTTDNITSRSQVVQQINTPEEGEIYALVILNENGLLSKLTVGTTTFASLQSTALDLGGVDAMTTNGFFMCNAPLINTPGSTSSPASGTVTTLAYIAADNIYHTQEQAMENPAAEIYVERGMAKVTMQAADSYTSTVAFEDGSALTVTVDGFALDQTNDVTYLVRNTTGTEDWWGYANTVSGDYRMAGNAPVATGIYRTYWAEDPNYDALPYSFDANGNKVYDQGMTSIIGDSSVDYDVLIGDEHPQYCLENTFNVAHQNDDETTRAIIKATFDTNGADFYIWDKNHSVLYTYEDIQNLILRAFEGTEEVENALHIYASDVDFYSHFTVSLEEVADGAITEASDDANIVITITTAFTENDFKDPDTGYTPYPVPAVCTEAGLADVVAALNDVHTIGAYEGGVSYYSVLIKHFGDDLTPWDDSVADTGATTENGRSYPANTIYGTTAEQAWLGRYSVLRNNWYDINVTAIAEPGSATPPEATGRPDDPTDLYISVNINILSWAKRTQDVSL